MPDLWLTDWSCVFLLVCREGIVFSMSVGENLPQGAPPPNLSFMEVLCEFTNKLMKQDKKTV